MERQIQAIETTYGGITYRSRLEARWAIFFHVLDLNVKYENVSVNLVYNDNVIDSYTPDFEIITKAFQRLNHRIFLEVKPAELTDEYIERYKAISEALYHSHNAHLIIGQGTFYDNNIVMFSPSRPSIKKILTDVFYDAYNIPYHVIRKAIDKAKKHRFDLK